MCEVGTSPFCRLCEQLSVCASGCEKILAFGRDMALFYCSSSIVSFSSLSPSSSSSLSSSSLLVTASAASRLCVKPITFPPSSFVRVASSPPLSMEKSGALTVRADSNIDGAGPVVDGDEASSKNKEVSLPVDKLPLESKLQERAAQKLRMKLAKKIRLRRKRLVRKRRLRKKGRWPPSKMKKLKNV